MFYVNATNDIDALLSIADTKTCRTCGDFKNHIEKRSRSIQVSANKLTFSKVTVFSSDGDFYTVHLVVGFPAGEEIEKKTGKKIDTLGAQKGLEGVNMQWRDGKWVLLDYDIVKEAGS